MQVDTKVIQHVIGRRKKKLAAETHQRKQTSPSTDMDKTLEKFTDKNIDENTFQEGERKRRAPNIIVHGLHEEPNESEDKAAKRFLKSLDMDINPKLAARLGKKKPGATRPLKIIMNNVMEKEKTMKSLPKLKRSKMKLHVTDDLTRKDRAIIANLLSEAKAKNAEETEAYVWRVTGSPTKRQLSRSRKKDGHQTTKERKTTLERCIEA